MVQQRMIQIYFSLGQFSLVQLKLNAIQFSLDWFYLVCFSLVEFQLVLFNFILFWESESHFWGPSIDYWTLGGTLQTLFSPKQMPLVQFGLAQTYCIQIGLVWLGPNQMPFSLVQERMGCRSRRQNGEFQGPKTFQIGEFQGPKKLRP